MAIINKGAVNICMHKVFISLGYIPRSNITELYAKSIIVLLETAKYLPKWLYQFSFLPATNKSSYYSTPSLALGGVSVLDFHHVNRYVVIFHHFNLQFPSGVQCEHLFICLFSICISSLARYLFRPFAHFLTGCPFSYCWFFKEFYVYFG